MEEKNKSTNEITVLLIVIIIALVGGLGYGYNKYTELINQYEEANSSSEDTGNDYDKFVKQMKEERTKLGGTSITVTFETPENSMVEGLDEYNVSLNKDGILMVNRKEIDKDVLLYRVAAYGNGGYKGLYYIKENGKVYFANIEEALINNKTAQINELKNLEKIVNIIPASHIDNSGGGAQQPVFIDIDGHIQEYNE